MNREMQFGIKITSDSRVAVGEAEKVEAAHQKVATTAVKVNQQVEASAKQAAFAMRMLPAQMTDIGVGLASGQSPFMVLIQQGGQLKDMFGGIGPAVKAMGSYIAGLVNPYTIAAAAAAGLTAAVVMGEEEFSSYARAIILTGNVLGTTVGQLQGISAQVSAATGVTTGAAAEAVTSLASTGKIAVDQIGMVAEAAIRMEQVGGPAIEATVKQFASLADKPVEASLKLNEQTNFLTAAIFEQIKALEEHGYKTEAAKIATQAYAESETEAAGKIKENLGTLERSWNDVATAGKAAWDAMLGVGRQEAGSQKLQTAQQQVEALRASVAALNASGTDSMWADFQKQRLATAEASLRALRDQVYGEDMLAAAIGKRKEQEQAGIKFAQEGNQYRTKSAKLAAELSAAVLTGIAAHKSEAEIVERVNAIQEKYAEKTRASTKAKKEEFDQGALFAKQLKAEEDLRKKAADEEQKRSAKLVAALDDEVESLKKKVAAEQQNYDLMGLSTAQQAERIAQEYERAAAMWEVNAAAVQAEIDAGNDAENLVLVNGKIKEQINLYLQLAGLKRGGALKAAADESAQEISKSMEKISDDITRNLVDAIWDGTLDGGEMLKKYFSSMVLTPTVKAIMEPVTNAAGELVGWAAKAATSSSSSGSSGSSNSTYIDGASAAYTGYQAYGTLTGTTATTTTTGGAVGLEAIGGAAGLGWIALIIAAFMVAMNDSEYGDSKVEGDAFVKQNSDGTATSMGNKWLDGSYWFTDGAGALNTSTGYMDNTASNRAALDSLGIKYGEERTIGDGYNQNDGKLGYTGKTWADTAENRAALDAAGIGYSVTDDVNSKVAAYLTPFVSNVDKLVTSLGGSATGLSYGLGVSADPYGTASTQITGAVADASGNVVYQQNRNAGGYSAEKVNTEVAVELQRMLLAAVKASDVDAAFKLIVDDIDLMTASADQLTAATNSLGLLKSVMDFGQADPFTEYAASVEAASLTIEQQLYKQRDAVTAAAAAYDGSTASVTALYNATQQRYSMELELAKQLDDALTQSASMWSDTRRNVELAGLNNGQKYDYFDAEAAKYADVLKTLTDTASIKDYEAKLKESITSAFSTLSTDQQLTYKNDFLTKIDSAEQLARSRYDAVKESTLTDNQKLREDISAAVQDAVSKISAAAAIPQQVAVTATVNVVGGGTSQVGGWSAD